MANDITTGIVCPSCGRKDAVIEVEYYVRSSSNETYIKHDYCGYRQLLSDYLKSLFTKRNQRANVPLSHIYTHELVVFSEDISTISTYRNILAQTNGFFTTSCFFYTGKLNELVCPICNGIEFTRKNKDIICKERHFEMFAEKFFVSSITSPFLITQTNVQNNESTHFIACEHQSDPSAASNFLHPTYKSDVAEIVYRFNPTNNKHVLVVSSLPTRNPSDYTIFLTGLRNSLGALYDIIEKVKVL